MKVPADRLEAKIAGALSPIYFISGDEPLLVGEAADRIRVRAREEGFGNRLVLNADRSFDWAELAAVGASLSLFAEKQLVELRIPTGKPGVAGSKAIKAYCVDPAPDTLLLVLAPRLDRNSMQSAWVRALDTAGVVVQVWPVDRGKLPAWITSRMHASGLQPGRGVADLIADRVEGNLLAADQEIQKLALLMDPGPVEVDDVLQAVADSARYDLFQLVDAACAGDSKRAFRILGGLKTEGTTPVLVHWALARELRALASVSWQISRGLPAANAMGKAKVWKSRQALVRSAMARHPLQNLHRLLKQASAVERVVKGATPGDPWQELTVLVTGLAGSSRPAGRAAA